MSGKFHFYLESIPLELDFVQFDGFQDLTTVTLESGSGIVDRQSGYDAHIFGCEIRHQYSSHWPIDHIYPTDISGADSHIISFVGAFLIQAWKVCRGMAEVGIHFEHIVVLVFDGPLETRNVSGTQAQLSFALYHEKTVGELLLHPLHNVGGTVRRVVFDNQNMKILL